MNENLAFDDRDLPAQAGGVNNTLNSSPAAGGGAPVIATPPASTNTVAIKPGKRTQNPLSNFSSYTYQLSLYMITPDAYDAFVESGRKNINSINNISPDVTFANTNSEAAAELLRESRRGNIPEPKAGGAYLIAQSGGINNTSSKRAPGFDTDFFIDDLKFTQMIGTKDVGSSTNISEISFTITEPYGFSLLTKLRRAQNALAATTNTKNFSMVQNPARQFFILGIRFLGYDKDGNIIDPTKIPSSDGNPEGNAFGLFERYIDILIKDMKFKITGKPVVYSITATAPHQAIGFGSKFSTIISDTTIVADTVYNALFAPGQDTTFNAARDSQAANVLYMSSLFSKLNYDQQQLVGKGLTIPRQYNVIFLGPDGEKIKKASLRSKADLDKRKVPTTTVSNTSESNQKAATLETPNNYLRTIKIAQGTSIIQAVSDIIKQSSYLEDALSQIDNTNLTPVPDSGTYEKQDVSPKELKWFNISAEVKNLGWDPNQGDYVYKITYIIQPYLTPVVVAASAAITTPYYGAHKRYNYWYTGKNSEVISYSQNLDFDYHNVAIQGYGLDTPIPSQAQGGATDIPMTVGQPQGQPDQGRINVGMEAQNMYMTSLFSPNDFGKATITILGDPDFIMQSAPSSINSLYNQFYGSDGFTINPNGGQVFIEINFIEPIDYQNSTGTLSLNNSIFFYKYPDYIQKDIDSRGGGISYMVNQVTSTFQRGKFTQELTCSLNTFQDPGPNKTTADQGREDPNQSKAETARLNRAGTGAALTPSGTGTTSGSGFAANPMSLDPQQLGKASLLGSVGSINSVMDPMQRLSASSITIQTKQGPVEDGDAGPGPR